MDRELLQPLIAEAGARWQELLRAQPSFVNRPDPPNEQVQRRWIDSLLELLADHLVERRRDLVFGVLESQVKRGDFSHTPIGEIVEGLLGLERILLELTPRLGDEERQREYRGRVREALMECLTRACRHYDEQVRTQKQRTDELIEEANLIHLHVDQRGRITRLNRRGAELLQIDPQSVLGRNLGQFVLPERLTAFSETIGYLLQGIPQMLELSAVFGGVRRELSMTIQPLFDGGKVVGARAIATDVTAGKALQAKLKRSEEKYRKLIENANDAIILTDLKQGLIVDANLRACEFVGTDKAQLVGRSLMELFSHEDEAKVIAMLQSTIFEGSSYNDNLRIRRRVGGEIWVATSSNVIEYGDVRVIQSILRDISERKKLEQKVVERTRELKRAYTDLQRYQEELVQSERAASLGDLTARLSSQLGEPLLEIESGLERTLGGLAEGEDPQRLRDRLSGVHQTVGQMRSVLDELLASPAAAEEASRLDVNQVIDDNLRLLGHHLIGRIKVRRELEQVPLITASRSVLDQVVFNLLRNSVSSTPEGGRLLIKTYVADGRMILEVADSGEGIPEQRLAEVLEPTLGRGVEGLPNYAVACRLVREHGGELNIDSKPGYGTLVRVSWPTGERRSLEHPLLVLDGREGEA